MVLNAVKAKSGDLPKDDSRLHADDLKYLAHRYFKWVN